MHACMVWFMGFCGWWGTTEQHFLCIDLCYARLILMLSGVGLSPFLFPFICVPSFTFILAYIVYLVYQLTFFTAKKLSHFIQTNHINTTDYIIKKKNYGLAWNLNILASSYIFKIIYLLPKCINTTTK